MFRLSNKKLYALLCILLALLGFTIFITYQRHITAYGTLDDIFQSDAIRIDDTIYRRKHDIDTYVLIGIDNAGGQADAIFLAVADNRARDLYLIPVNRNMMAEIDCYTFNGEYLGKQTAQMCLSHSMVYTYADANLATQNALSKLLYNVPIDYYVALEMDGISALGGAIGDVNIVLNETLESVDFVAGESVTVHTDNIEQYLRARDLTQLGGSHKRLERQTSYILACYDKLHSSKGLLDIVFHSSDGWSLGTIRDKYNAVKPYITTNVPDIVNAGAKYLTYTLKDSHVYFAPHTTIYNPETLYEECYLMEAEMKEILLKVFYRPALY